jgi:spore maturation protein CgeB
MKLLIVGSDKVYAIENFYVKYLRELNVDVAHFSAQTIFYDFYQKHIFNKLAYRSGLSGIIKKINTHFRIVVEQFKPDIIWVFKGMEIYPESLKWAKARDIFLVNYNGDSPFIFSGKGSGNSNVSNSLSLYDLFLTYNKADKAIMETGYKIKSEILSFGFNLDNELYEECLELNEVKKVCFLGNPDSFRGGFLNSLAAAGVKIDVYGNSWNKFVSHPNITVFEPILGNEFWRVLRKYRVQLNLMRPHNPTTHNMRTFECGGIGAIQLAPDTPDHRDYFKNEEEIFLFDNMQECRRKIEYLLNMGKEDADKVRENARRRSIQDGYSYQCRSVQALSYLNKML